MAAAAAYAKQTGFGRSSFRSDSAHHGFLHMAPEPTREAVVGSFA